MYNVSDKIPPSLLLTLQKSVLNTFNKSDWIEFGYETDCVDLITDHPRLLRSLWHGDDDYSSYIFYILEEIFRTNPDTLSILLKKDTVKRWIQNNDRQIYDELYEDKKYIEKFSPEKTLSYDIFISHASEDKDDFVRPLAVALKALDVKVWYDEFTLKVGDSLRKNIDQGLVKSTYGALVLSSSFFKKKWTEYEFNGMVAKEINDHKMILPIWHKISQTDVLNFSPTLADKVALDSSLKTIEEIAQELFEVVKGSA